MDPLELLTRKDKWFLGGGKGALYAPPFPKSLSAVGFWDECYFADIRIPRLFTVLPLNVSGKPIKLTAQVVNWRPDRLILDHVGHGVVLRETRCVTEQNAWVAHLELIDSSDPLHLVQWAMLDLRPKGYGAPWQSVSEVEVEENALQARFDTAWPAELEPDRTAVEQENLNAEGAPMLDPLPVYLSFGASQPRASWTVNLAQRHDESPLYELSMLPEKFRSGLPGECQWQVGPEPAEGLVHLYQHTTLRSGEAITFACGAGLDREAARTALQDAIQPEIVARCEQAWRTYFDGVPQFNSSDPYLNAAYWYRWYGIRLNTVDMSLPICGSDERYSPYVTEGIGFFRNFITYSAQAHLREVSWMRDPSLALGILENLAKVQRPDGSYPGHNYSARPARDFYHADFATGAARLQALHGIDLSQTIQDSLRAYAAHWRQSPLSPPWERDRERGNPDSNTPSPAPGERGQGGEGRTPIAPDQNSPFPDASRLTPHAPRWHPTAGALVFDMNETGQEYMSRYQFVSADADKWGSFRVGGRDSNAYVQALFDFLQEPAPKASDGYDPDAEFFSDVLPDGTLSPARPATGFYPLIYALDATPQMLACVERWLLNEGEFWLPKGFPATALSDPTFSAEGEWKGKRLNCPWNGRSWPMANSHVVDALCNVARLTQDERLRNKAGEAVRKAIELMFHGADPARPNSYEHYDPITGVPALYRGYDDYMHSWIVDLILRHVVGVQPGKEEVDPLPLDVEWIECHNLPRPNGGTMSVTICNFGNEQRATVDFT